MKNSFNCFTTKPFKLLLTTVIFLTVTTFFSKALAYDAVVAKDGSGNYTSVQAAITAAPNNGTTAWVIFIKNGKYREKISVASTKTFIQLVGESVANTILYYDDPATVLGTQNSASFSIMGNDFSAFNITFANTYGDGSQAVALLVNADRAAFKNCRFLGNQDTLYLKGSGTPRCYFKNCYIDGNVDFIFGSAAALFDSCVVYAKTRTSTGSSYITAPNTPTGQTYGLTFRDTKFPNNTGGTLYYLSRPWPSPSEAATRQKAILLSCVLSSHIQPAGWVIWDANTITANLTNAEYNSRYFNGTAVDISQRAAWSTQLTQSDSATYAMGNIFTTWDPCALSSTSFCNPNSRDIAVSNFRGAKGATTSKFDWNISWGMTGIQYDLYRSSDNVNFSIINTQTATTDTAVNFSYTDANPAANTAYYYYVKASLSGYASHYTDTVVISSVPTITTTGSISSFTQSLGTPSSSQSYTVSGVNLTNNVVITAPANFEISNGGTTWINSSSNITLTPTSGVLAATTISVRLNGSSLGSPSGNVSHASTNAATVNLAVSGTVQSAPLLVSNTIQQWPFTINGNDSAAVRATGLSASTPTLARLFLSNGTTLSTVPAYSTLHGQAYGPTSNGDGTWTSVGGNLNRTFYEQFTITSGSLYTVRVDSLILNSSFYNTSSSTKMAVVYSKNGFSSPADSTNVTGGLDPTGVGLASGANGGFTTPILLANETAGTTKNYRLALNGSTGVTLVGNQTLTIRIYNSCSSTGTPRYGKIKNVIAKGQAGLTCPTSVTPSVAIAANPGTSVCGGNDVLFTATPTSGGSAPSYQWKLNGNNVGTNSASYINSTIANNDVVSCVMTANNTCQTSATGTSNTLTMSVSNPATSPSVSIAADVNNVCANTAVTITATPTNGGSSPTYNFKVNGVSKQNGSSNTYTSYTLANHDIITCVITRGDACANSGTSNAVSMTIKSTPATPLITGGAVKNCIIGSSTNLYASAWSGTWSSSNPTVAGISSGQTGSNSTTVTALSNGTSTITFTLSNATNGCGSSASAVYSVVSIPVNAISSVSSTCVGGSTFTATDSTDITGLTAVWASENNRLSIDNAGVVTPGSSAGVGTISYTVRNATTGCFTKVTKSITINAQPAIPTVNVVPAIGNSNAICSGRDYQFTGTPGGGTWTTTASAGVATLTGGGLLHTVGAGSATLSYTTAPNVNGCTNRRNFTGTIISCFAREANPILTPSINQSINLYPNPAKGIVNLTLNKMTSTGAIIITDLYGKIIMNYPLRQALGDNGIKHSIVQTLDISSLNKGIYLMNIITSEGKTTKKLIVE